RYGRERAALVAAFPTFRARGAIRELGKVLGLPAGEIERLARGAEVHGQPAGRDIVAGRAAPDGPDARRAPASAPSERWRWLERSVEERARVRSERIDLSRIQSDHPHTFKAIRAADTVGSFQIESRAQMQSLRRTQPTNLADLTIQVAIVRPGPIQGGAINPYIERRRRLREDPAYEIPYEHPALRPILKDTLGTIIFQDQVMEVAEV